MLLKAFYSKNVSLRHLPTEFQTFTSVRKSFDLIVQNAMYLLFQYSLDFLLNFGALSIKAVLRLHTLVHF